jgi:hypothetical protein
MFQPLDSATPGRPPKVFGVGKVCFYVFLFKKLCLWNNPVSGFDHAQCHHGQLGLSLAFPPIDVGEENSLLYWRLRM